MGIGDEIMVTGEVRKLVLRKTGVRVAVRDLRHGAGPKWHRWHPVWDGNPHIARPGEPFDEILDNGPSNRPYIDGKSVRFWVWKEYGPEPGELYLTDAERALGSYARDRIVIQPFIKASASPNKLWPMAFWQDLVFQTAHRFHWLQIGEGNEPRVYGAEFLRTASFRDACGVLAGARAAVLHEGGLHHACAALGTPAVVIFGGFISPSVTGYASQANLFVDSPQHPLGCGARTPCFHCHRAMQSIRPEIVVAHLERIINGT